MNINTPYYFCEDHVEYALDLFVDTFEYVPSFNLVPENVGEQPCFKCDTIARYELIMKERE